MKNKEKIIRELLDTFDDRSHLHIEYKKKMVLIIVSSFCDILIKYLNASSSEEIDIKKWAEDFVEQNFKPQD